MASDVPDSTVIQDIPIPKSVMFYDVTPADAITLLLQALSNRGASAAFSEDFFTSLSEELMVLSRVVRSNVDDLHARARNLCTVKSNIEHCAAKDNKRRDHDETSSEDSMEALIQILSSARFTILPTLPSVEDPPPVDAVSVVSTIPNELDATWLSMNNAVQDIVREHKKRRYPIRLSNSNGIFPHIFYATRGTALKRTSGLQLYAKWQAAERFIMSVVLSPAMLLFRTAMDAASKLSATVGAELLRTDKTITNVDQSLTNSGDEGRKVRRVVPSVSSNEILIESLIQLKPLITQEPCHSLLFLLYRPLRGEQSDVGRSSASSRKSKPSQVDNLFRPAFPRFEVGSSLRPQSARKEKGDKETEVNSLCESANHLNSTSEESVAQIFYNVPWGTVHHVLPASNVVPAARDLLRLDLFTLTWLATTLFTSHRITDRSLAAAPLLFAVLSYAVKVVIGWQNAVNVYDRRIAKQKLESLLCQGSCCIDYVVMLAVQEDFVDAACVWLASLEDVKRLGIEDAVQLQKEAFSSSRLTEVEVKGWSTWLSENTASTLF